jgi:hypothetical protein
MQSATNCAFGSSDLDALRRKPDGQMRNLFLTTSQVSGECRLPLNFIAWKFGFDVGIVGIAKQGNSKDVVSNKFPSWLVRFGRTASLQIAHVAWPHRAICA